MVSEIARMIKETGNQYLYVHEYWKIKGEIDFGLADANDVMADIDLYEDDIGKPIVSGRYTYKILLDHHLDTTSFDDNYCIIGKVTVFDGEDPVAQSLIRFNVINISRYLNEPDFAVVRYRKNHHHHLALEIVDMLKRHNSGE